MLKTRYTIAYVALMTLVVVASNFLVQFPLNAEVAGINLADILTWG
ncbi:VUT family protein, partial [Rhizobium ruizarguesonis]